MTMLYELNIKRSIEQFKVDINLIIYFYREPSTALVEVPAPSLVGAEEEEAILKTTKGTTEVRLMYRA